MAPELPEAATKLRLVLDYLPCEACLAQPTADQDLLCSICARTSRQVAVRVSTRTTVVLERPSPPEPVVIPPAAPAPPPEPAPARELVVRFADEPASDKVGAIEVVVEPLAPPAPVVVPVPAPVGEEEPEFAIDDLVDYVPARDEFFDFRPGPAERAPEPAPEPVDATVTEEPASDDFVFRAPPEEAPAPAQEELPEPVPVEEIPVEPEQEPSRWAPPPDFLAEEEPQPEPAQEARPEPAPEPEPEPLEMEVVEEPADEPLEMEIVEDEEPVEMELVEDAPAEPAPARGATDLYRLRGFEPAHEQALAKANITEVAHLSGHDAGELATRASLPFEKVLAWVQVADLVQEVGVPLDAANALVAAGVQGPRGLRESDEADLADRVGAFGGYAVSEREIKRWKRRA